MVACGINIAWGSEKTTRAASYSNFPRGSDLYCPITVPAGFLGTTVETSSLGWNPRAEKLTDPTGHPAPRLFLHQSPLRVPSLDHNIEVVDHINPRLQA